MFFRQPDSTAPNMAQIHAMTPLHASPELFEPIQTARWQPREGQHLAAILAALPKWKQHILGIIFSNLIVFL